MRPTGKGPADRDVTGAGDDWDDDVEDLSEFGFDDPEEGWIDQLNRAEEAPDPGRLGPYELLDKVGRGGQGVVFRARQPGTGRDIALKRLVAGAFSSDVERQRFEREVAAAAELDHPNIVTIHGVEQIDGEPVLVMQWIEGVPLTEWARPGRRAPAAERDPAPVPQDRDRRAARPPARGDPPRPEAGQRARRCGGRTAPARLRPGQARGGRGEDADRVRRLRGHAPLRGARAGSRRSRGRAHGRVLARRAAVRAGHGPLPLRARRDPGRDARRDRAPGADAPLALGRTRLPRPRHDPAQGPREGTLRPLRHRRGPGHGPAPPAAPRADPRARAERALRPAQVPAALLDRLDRGRGGLRPGDDPRGAGEHPVQPPRTTARPGLGRRGQVARGAGVPAALPDRAALGHARPGRDRARGPRGSGRRRGRRFPQRSRRARGGRDQPGRQLLRRRGAGPQRAAPALGHRAVRAARPRAGPVPDRGLHHSGPHRAHPAQLRGVRALPAPRPRADRGGRRARRARGRRGEAADRPDPRLHGAAPARPSCCARTTWPCSPTPGRTSDRCCARSRR